MAKIVVVYNPLSGSANLDGLKQSFTRHKVDVEYVQMTSRQLRRHLTGANVAVAAGGDGTINTVVSHIHGTATKLGVLPLGTLNHFAGALGIAANLDEAVDTVIAGHTRRVDIGTVNNHVFINNSSIGVYPRSLRVREEYQSKIGKWPAALLGLARSVVRPRHYYVETRLDGVLRSFRTPFVFVGNNEYQRSGPSLGERTTLESGKLAVYVLKATTPLTIINSLLHTFLTSKRHTKDFAIYLTESCTIHTKHHRRLRVACDGEAFAIQSPLQYTSHHKALSVIVPKETT
jgi:diacylglycerol kinase family enzyme